MSKQQARQALKNVKKSIIKLLTYRFQMTGIQRKKKHYTYTANCVHYSDVLVCTITKENSGSIFDHYPPE